MNNNFSLDVYGKLEQPHVLFFGGWGVSAESYRERLLLLGEHFRIYGVSLPGFGDNEPLDLKRNHIKGHADFFQTEIMPTLDLDSKFVMMGHSTGAGVATLIANNAKDSIDKLILISPVGSPDPLNKSLLRMIAEVDIREALKYSTASYWKRALPNMRLGIDAKYIDLTQPINSLIDAGKPVFIFLSKDDKIAPPGKLSDISNATITWVDGGHAWFKRNPEDLLTSMVQIIYPEDIQIEVPEAEETLISWIAKKLLPKKLLNRI